jgi:hypothetical protein
MSQFVDCSLFLKDLEFNYISRDPFHFHTVLLLSFQIKLEYSTRQPRQGWKKTETLIENFRDCEFNIPTPGSRSNYKSQKEKDKKKKKRVSIRKILFTSLKKEGH